MQFYATFYEVPMTTRFNVLLVFFSSYSLFLRVRVYVRVYTCTCAFSVFSSSSSFFYLVFFLFILFKLSSRENRSLRNFTKYPDASLSAYSLNIHHIIT